MCSLTFMLIRTCVFVAITLLCELCVPYQLLLAQCEFVLNLAHQNCVGFLYMDIRGSGDG